MTHIASHCRQLEWLSELDLLNNTSLVCYKFTILYRYHCIGSLLFYTQSEKLSSGTQSLVQCRSMFQQCQDLHDAKKEHLTQQ